VSAPAARLDVGGAIKVGSTAEACSTALRGTLRYNTTSNILEVCNGTAWTALGAGSSGGGGSSNLLAATFAVINTSSLSPSGWYDAMAVLDNTTVAYASANFSASDALYTLKWNGSQWAQQGNSLNLGSGQVYSTMAALSASSVAQFSRDQAVLRRFDWNGSTWAQVGNGLVLSAAGTPAMTAIASNTIVMIQNDHRTLRAYQFNGSSWSQQGSASPVLPNSAAPSTIQNRTAMTTLKPWDGTSARVVVSYNVYPNGNNSSVVYVQAYDWNGSTFTAVGSTLTPANTDNHSSITAMDNEHIAFTTSGAQGMRIYRLNGTTWETGANAFPTCAGANPTMVERISATRLVCRKSSSLLTVDLTY
jgi:hypothetical protein